ncbi:carbamoyltransferase HypF [Candidatus Acidulodesulfobacterium sp. H_13]|uniref:carbamoyltransferase HypF n=1 Tax=Candidatus Acidulodesulfobacterium sp. H_13 TaxID=3395470 RepID=UPI003AF8044A
MKDKDNENFKRVIINISGRVQGVGFRPFVFKLAKKYSIRGNILNDLDGVTIDAQGTENDLMNFMKSLDSKRPPLAVIDVKTFRFLRPTFYSDFEIKKSNKTDDINNAENLNLIIPPDIATCDECLKELSDPSDRRYFYPFINCTDCGPRFTITKKLPYDRVSTAMDKFKMCPECEIEYRDPTNRRFHAEPNGCFACGPKVEFIKPHGLCPDSLCSKKDEKIKGFNAIKTTVQILKNGGIVCVKGVGGFHLMTDATNDDAVKLLRERKKRLKKPFAVMFKDICEVSKYAYTDNISIPLLLSGRRPIVLLEDKRNLSYFVNCGTKNIGVFLPYAPIHHIIFSLFHKPLIATSANMAGEPIVKDNDEALFKLKSIADGFLIHDRDIYRRCDDSVIKIIKGNDQVFIRRSRGYVPDPIKLPFGLKRNVLAVGSYLKNTFAIAYSGNINDNDNKGAVILSQHNGDLDNIDSFINFTENVEDFEIFYNFKPSLIVCDSHPRYENTKWAEDLAKKRGIKHVTLQHHRAHIISCMAENGLGLKDDVFGVAFDGTGYGDDGSIWGGEFFKGNYMHLNRVGTFKRFRLIGGDKAVKSPQRVLLSLLFTIFTENRGRYVENYDFMRKLNDCSPDKKDFNPDILLKLTGIPAKNINIFFKMWDRGINSPYTSSCGRIFDAVSCLCGFRGDISCEGEAAVYLEDLCGREETELSDDEIEKSDCFGYAVDYNKIDDLFIVDYCPMLIQIIEIIINNRNPEDPESLMALYKDIAERFINTIALVIKDIALRIGCKNVCMSGGVFQNAFLPEKIDRIMNKSGFSVFFNRKIPPNDGGISFGQAVYGGLIDDK